MNEQKLELEVYINGIPDLKFMPKDIAEAFICALEEDISAWVEQNKKGKAR